MDESKNVNNGQIAQAEAGGNWLILTAGWICAVISLILYPFIFGVIGVIMGILASKNGSRTGLSLIVASISLMGIGLILGKPLLSFTRHILGI